MLEEIFGSRVRAKLLSWLFSHADKRYYVRQLETIINEDATHISRELTRLERLGIVISEKTGNAKFFTANSASPIFKEMKGLALRARDIEGHHKEVKNGLGMKTLEEIKDILKKEKPFLKEKYGVSEIGLFGSFVRGEQKKKSDLDILVGFDRPIGFFRFLELEEYLKKRVGVRVDLVTKDALKPRIGRSILQELLPV